MIYNVVLVVGVQQSDSVIHIPVHLHSFKLSTFIISVSARCLSALWATLCHSPLVPKTPPLSRALSLAAGENHLEGFKMTHAHEGSYYER